MKVYKLTDQNMQTHNGYQWQLQEWQETDGSGELCGSGWLHFYADPLLALLLNPIHAAIAAPRLFEIEIAGKTLEDHGLKAGCTKMQLVKELELPAVTLEQRIKFGILCALEVCQEPSFVQWAAKWLDGSNRSIEAAAAAWAAAWAAAAADAAARAAARAAWAAIKFFDAADDADDAASEAAAANAAKAAAWAAKSKLVDLIAIAHKAMG